MAPDRDLKKNRQMKQGLALMIYSFSDDYFVAIYLYDFLHFISRLSCVQKARLGLGLIKRIISVGILPGFGKRWRDVQLPALV